ncbi:MAG: nuclear transport factor 2 family protein [Pseudomonadota bacterium]
MTDISLKELAERVAQLEDERAIRDLKARYLRACDLKDVDTVRDTLLPDGARIEFEGFPLFEDREPFVQVYNEMGCAPGIFDIHHAANGVIALTGADTAEGRWSLLYHNINLTERTLTQLGVEYADRYVRQDGRWWIAETRSWRNSMLVESFDETGARTITVAGEAPEA